MGAHGAPWYRDAAARTLILERCLPTLAALNLVWEIAQLPLYTIWTEGSAGYKAFAVLHCTAGDVLIGLVSLTLALMITRAGRVASWNWAAIALLLVMIGVAYTVFSEWNNTVLRPAWAYSELMPVIRLGDVSFGLSPLMQWLLLPPVSLWAVQRSVARFS